MTTRVLNQHQVQWALSLSQFQFVITSSWVPKRETCELFCHLYPTPKEGDVAYE